MPTAAIEKNWRTLKVSQQPSYLDQDRAREVFSELSASQPLVSTKEIDQLIEKLELVSRGQAFILQAGSCAETFNTPQPALTSLVRIMLQMTVILMYGAQVQVVKLGRWAGQYGKPRSSDVDSQGLLSYKGDMINGLDANPTSRRHDPARLLAAYSDAKRTLAEVKRLTTGEMADLLKINSFNGDFAESSPEAHQYIQLTNHIEDALGFMSACDIDLSGIEALRMAVMYASHEGLVLEYENALTRDGYDLSGHYIWIGERTRQLDQAHIAFFRTIKNPIGVKLGPTTTPEEVKSYCRMLNPDNIPGRLTFVSRMGASNVRANLPKLIEAATDTGCPVVWMCDPMHGNTVTVNGYKTRKITVIKDEIAGFFEICKQLNVWPGGIHIEITGESVTECLGGERQITPDDLPSKYTSACDPRLNARQSLEIAFFVAELLKSYKSNDQSS